MDASDMAQDLERVLVSEDEVAARLAELAEEIAAEYAGKDLLLVGVLKGAVMVMADLMRALPISAPVDWMAVSSYGSGTKSSGVVRILKDLDVDITDKHVLIVEDIVDSGLDIPNEFVVGYGLDYAEQYRGLRQIATLAPHVYS